MSQPTYCSVADVQALTPRKFGQGNNPSNADVLVMIEGVEAELNAILINKGYTVPISKAEAPQAFQFMRRVCMQGAVVDVEQVGGNGPNLDRYEKKYRANFQLIIEAREIMNAPQEAARDEPRGPGMTTTGQTLTEGEPPTAQPAAGGELENSNPLSPFFQRNMIF